MRTPTDASGSPLSIERFLHRIPEAETHRCVFMSGSSTRGWAHATSDLDFFVIIDEPVAIDATLVKHDLSVEPPEVRVLVRRTDDVRWDVEFWLDAQVRQIVDRCFVEDPDQSLRRPFTHCEADLAYRLRQAIALSGEPWLEDVRSALERSRLQSILVNRALYGADGLLDDTAGLLLSGDLHTAALAVRDAFGRVVDALLIDAGELCPGPKWRARRLLEVRPNALPWDEYWSVETMRAYTPEHARSWIEDTMDRCRRLMMEIDAS
ncbi:MAG TPA: nucleotidyltransferase domain-containing protein [Candidatus Dormibacteraeota bacterium]|nr:nucleotidyltransferase domain-containing protein [Candidatus Dormibacteraeota bacterium]